MPKKRPSQTSHLIIACSVYESLDLSILPYQSSIVRNQLTPK